MTIENLSEKSVFRYLAVSIAFIILFLLLTRLSIMFTIASGVMVWYAPAGLNMALLIVFGLKYAPVIFIAGLLGGVWVLAPDAGILPLTLEAATTPAFEALAVLLMRQTIGTDWKHWNLREFNVFILFMVAAPVFTSTAGISNYCWFGMVAWNDFASIFLVWWIGDVVGILTLTPFILFTICPVIHSIKRRAAAPAQWIESIDTRPALIFTQTIFILLALWFSFLSPPAISYRYHLHYFCFPPLIWIVFTHGLAGGAIALAAMNTGASLITVKMSGISEIENLQFFLMVLSLAGLELGKSLDEQKRSAQALKRREAQLSDITNKLPGMVYQYVLHPDGSFSVPYISGKVYDYLAMRPEEIIQKPQLMFDAVHPFPGNVRELENIIAGGVLRESGKILSAVSTPQLKANIVDADDSHESFLSLEALEKQHILFYNMILLLFHCVRFILKVH